MAKIIWSDPAIEDLKTIYDFYESKSLVAATKIVEELIQQGEDLKVNIIHQREPYLLQKHRRKVYKNYKIIYSINSENLQILRVFDARQDPKKLGVIE